MEAKRWWVAIACFAASGVAQAQGLADGMIKVQATEKPAPSRFYGTARPPSMQPGPGGGGGAPPVARPPAFSSPPAVVSPPSSVYFPPPHARPPVYVRPPPRVGVDVVIGTPRPYYYGGPRYVYPPGWGYPTYPAYPVYPPVVVTPPPPPVYIERPAEPEQPVAGYWYWCADPQGWYPEVNECAPGWQAVPPRAAQ